MRRRDRGVGLPLWRPRPGSKFPAQVDPFKSQLTSGCLHLRAHTTSAELAAIEPVAAAIGFVADNRKVSVEAGDRTGGGLKPRELGMVAIPARRAGEHRASQQPFAPQRDQPGGVEVSWMQSP